MKPIYPTTFIVSSNNIEQLEKDLDNKQLPHKRVLGRYNGTNETSLVVVTDFQFTLTTIAKAHNQECILKLDPTRFATLINVKTNEELDLGQFTAYKCEPEGDYTFDGRTYWVAE